MPLLTPSERIGTTVANRYSLTRIAGQGASAVLFAGVDLSLERDVAVKVMRPDGALAGTAERERFRREALTLAKLRYRNLVEVYDVGETSDGMPFVVMELLQGESLAERLERTKTVSIEDALSITLPLMGALASAHDVGVIHRDVKPANVFLQDAGSRGAIPKLLDFGIAKVEARSGLTSSGLALGTPAYMAPEQARGEPLGPQADVWAMGVMLFRMLSGRLPFEASTAAGVLWEATRGTSSSLCSVAPSLDRAVAACIERALVPDLSRRHADMRAFAESLTRTGRRIGLALPDASELAGLPGYAGWCDATDAEVRTAPHLAESPSRPLLASIAASAQTVHAPEATQATRSQANRVRPRRRLVRATALLTLGSVLTLGAWTWWPSPWSASKAGPSVVEARPSSRGTPEPAVPAGPARAPVIVDPILQAPMAPVPSQEPEAARPHNPRPRDKKSAQRKVERTDSPQTETPKPKLVTDFEW